MTRTVAELIAKLQTYDARTPVVLPLYSAREGIGTNGATNVDNFDRLLPKTTMLNRDGKATEVVTVNIEADVFVPDDDACLTEYTLAENLTRLEGLDYIYPDVSKPEPKYGYYNVMLINGDVVVAKMRDPYIDPEKVTMVELSYHDQKRSGLVTPDKVTVTDMRPYELGVLKTDYTIIDAQEVR